MVAVSPPRLSETLVACVDVALRVTSDERSQPAHDVEAALGYEQLDGFAYGVTCEPCLLDDVTPTQRPRRSAAYSRPCTASDPPGIIAGLARSRVVPGDLWPCMGARKGSHHGLVVSCYQAKESA